MNHDTYLTSAYYNIIYIPSNVFLIAPLGDLFCQVITRACVAQYSLDLEICPSLVCSSTGPVYFESSNTSLMR